MSLFMSMKKWVKKKAALIGLAMSSVEKNALSQKGESLEKNVSQERRHTQGQLLDSLINGQITEEVENLRWRMYKVLQGAEAVTTKIVGHKNGEPIFETNKRNLTEELLAVKVDKHDNFPLDLIVNNDDISLTSLDSMSVDFSDIASEEPTINYDVDGNIISATHGMIDAISYFAKNKPSKPIVINRSSLPRFEIESYTKKLVVRSINETEKLLEFYVSKYPDEFNRNSRLFISEIKKAIVTPRNSDMLTMDGVKFVTYKDVGVSNYLEFEYKITSFDKIVDFDGNYVIKFKGQIVTNGKNVLEQYRKENLDKKYENKERRKS